MNLPADALFISISFDLCGSIARLSLMAPLPVLLRVPGLADDSLSVAA